MAREPNDTVQLKLRFREELRRRLEDAAAISGQSLNSEIVDRLERSLRDDSEFGGVEQAKVVRAIVRIMEAVSEEFGVSWQHERGAWDVVRASVGFLLAILEPRDDEDSTPPELDLSGENAEIMRRYREARAHFDESQRKYGADVATLIMKREQAGLTEAEQDELNALLLRGPAEKPEPELSEADLAIWRAQEQYADKHDRARRRAEGVSQPFLLRSKFV